MNRLVITTLLLLWGSLSSAKAAPIIFDFTGVVDSGSYTGISFSGSVSFDSSSTNSVDYQVNLVNGGIFIPQLHWGDSGFTPGAGTSNSGYSEDGVSLSIFRDDSASEITIHSISPYLYSTTYANSIFSLSALFSGSTPLMNGTGSIHLSEDVIYEGCGSGVGNCSMSVYYDMTGTLTNISLRGSTTVPEPSTIFLMAAGIAGFGFSRKKVKQ